MYLHVHLFDRKLSKNEETLDKNEKLNNIQGNKNHLNRENTSNENKIQKPVKQDQQVSIFNYTI